MTTDIGDTHTECIVLNERRDSGTNQCEVGILSTLNIHANTAKLAEQVNLPTTPCLASALDKADLSPNIDNNNNSGISGGDDGNKGWFNWVPPLPSIGALPELPLTMPGLNRTLSDTMETVTDAANGLARTASRLVRGTSDIASGAASVAISAAQNAFDVTSIVFYTGFDFARMTTEQYMDFVKSRLSEPERLKKLRKFLAQFDLGDFAQGLNEQPFCLTCEGLVNIPEAQIQEIETKMQWTYVQRMSFLKACQKQRAKPTFFSLGLEKCNHKIAVPGYEQPIPSILVEYASCIRSLGRGFATTGLFRISPDFKYVEHIETMTEENNFRFCEELEDKDSLLMIHAICSCMKKYFRSLPVRLLEPLSKDCLNCQSGSDARDQINRQLLPHHLSVVQWLLDFLREIDAAQAARPDSDTSIRSASLAIVFSASLFADMDIVQMTMELGIAAVQAVVREQTDKNTAFIRKLLEVPHSNIHSISESELTKTDFIGKNLVVAKKTGE
jgi:hypothetical protein